MIDGGKAGILVAVDAETGKPIWKTEVGVHNGHQNDNIAALHGDFSKLHAPVTIEPGDLGGIESQLASDGKTVYAAVNNLPSHYASDDGGLSAVSFANPSSGTGDIVAVDEATGKIKWDNKLPSSPYGAATLTNGVLFTTTYRRHAVRVQQRHGRRALEDEALRWDERAGGCLRRHTSSSPRVSPAARTRSR